MVPVCFEGQENGKDYVTRSFMTFMICALHHIIILVIKSRKIRWAGHVAHYEG